LYRDRAARNKICTMTAKTRAIPSLHRDSFLAKVPGLCPVLASGNGYSLNRRAVSIYAGAKTSGQFTYSKTVFASMIDRTNANGKGKLQLCFRDLENFNIFNPD
jgi:hypothetical protein